MTERIKVQSINEMYKARTPGAKDIKPRKRHSKAIRDISQRTGFKNIEIHEVGEKKIIPNFGAYHEVHWSGDHPVSKERKHDKILVIPSKIDKALIRIDTIKSIDEVYLEKQDNN